MYFDRDDVQNRLPDSIFESLLGGTYDFYGVDNNAFCIGVNGARMALEAIEDPSDGYRSYFGCFRTEEVGRIFFGQPIARVTLLEGGLSERVHCYCEDEKELGESGKSVCSKHLEAQKDNFNGWILKDVDTGHVWLTVGTDYADSYYPFFTFRYEPDTTRQIEVNDD